MTKLPACICRHQNASRSRRNQSGIALLPCITSETNTKSKQPTTEGQARPTLAGLNGTHVQRPDVCSLCMQMLMQTNAEAAAEGLTGQPR